MTIIYFLYYISAYTQHNVEVSHEKKVKCRGYSLNSCVSDPNIFQRKAVGKNAITLPHSIHSSFDPTVRGSASEMLQ
jgi:hypothetical protein